MQSALGFSNRRVYDRARNNYDFNTLQKLNGGCRLSTASNDPDRVYIRM